MLARRITQAALVLFCYSAVSFGEVRRLILVGEGHPPFEMLGPNGTAVGVNVDVATEIFGKLGIPFKAEIHMWSRCWHLLKTGAADVGMTVSRNEERAPYLLYPEEDVWNAEFVFFTSTKAKQQKQIGYEEALAQKLRVGIVTGNGYHQSFWDTFPYQDAEKKKVHKQIDPAMNMEQNLRKLLAGHIDVFPAEIKSITYEIARLKLEGLTHYDKILFSKGYPMPFARNSTYPNLPKIAQQFEAELKKMKKDGRYDKIVTKWFIKSH